MEDGQLFIGSQCMMWAERKHKNPVKHYILDKINEPPKLSVMKSKLHLGQGR